MLKKVELFLRTRSHVLVVMGALIVFLTFVIEEGLREHWKGTADATETAEYFYPLLAQSGEIRKELKKVEDQQFKIANPPGKTKAKFNELSITVRSTPQGLGEGFARPAGYTDD